VNKKYTKLFKDIKLKQEMLDMLLAGYSYSEIACHFNCDVSTIRYHKNQRGITRSPCKSGRPRIKPKTPPIWDGEPINRGLLTYKEYRDREKARKERHFWER